MRCIIRIAITGATGFLGRYIVRQLAKAGHKLVCWYRPESSDLGGFADVASNITWMPGNLLDAASIASLCDGVDAVVHGALQWERDGGFRASGKEDLLGFLEANLMGSLRLIDTAYKNKVGRFVFISTCAVNEIILPDRPLDESHPTWALTHYGAHKAAIENFVHSYGMGWRWPICAIRPTGIYGLAHPPKASKWYGLVKQVLAGEPVRSAGGGKEVHAADVAKAVELVLAAEEKLVNGQAFNCYDRYIADQEVAILAKRLTGSASAIAQENKGPKNQIATGKLQALGMVFGGTPLLESTIRELIDSQRSPS